MVDAMRMILIRKNGWFVMPAWLPQSQRFLSGGSMTAITKDALANVVFTLSWEEDGARHRDRFYAQHVNLWRDYFPGDLGSCLQGLQAGDTVRVPLVSGMHLPAREIGKVRTIRERAFKPVLEHVRPEYGRFYPQGVVRGLPGVFPQNTQPMRVTAVEDGNLAVDLNHPLAGLDLQLEIEVLEVWDKNAEFGGQCRDWVCALTDGPGLKRTCPGGADFGLDRPLVKPLGSSDRQFYATPRKVAHVDSQARINIERVYADLLSGRTRILDLMAGWQSHLPEGLTATGLGMNEEEMQDNPALQDVIVHDLNENPVLPFADTGFDAVVCSLSVEYLTRPVEVLREVARVLEPGGLAVLVFSHRWFPDQAVQIWTEMHEFERAGMVTEMFRQTGAFGDLQTLSLRGWPRPMDARDRYYPMIQHSDPIHAVWGTVKK